MGPQPRGLIFRKVWEVEGSKIWRGSCGLRFATNNICDYASAAKHSEVFIKQIGSMGMEALANLN